MLLIILLMWHIWDMVNFLVAADCWNHFNIVGCLSCSFRHPAFTCWCLQTLSFQVNVSERGLVTPAGKVVWGKASVECSAYFAF